VLRGVGEGCDVGFEGCGFGMFGIFLSLLRYVGLQLEPQMRVESRGNGRG